MGDRIVGEIPAAGKPNHSDFRRIDQLLTCQFLDCGIDTLDKVFTLARGFANCMCTVNDAPRGLPMWRIHYQNGNTLSRDSLRGIDCKMSAIRFEKLRCIKI